MKESDMEPAETLNSLLLFIVAGHLSSLPVISPLNRLAFT